jgi:DNA-binding NtrC family response regulator
MNEVGEGAWWHTRSHGRRDDRRRAHASRDDMKVLVVDDERDVRAAVTEYLALHGMEVLEATNGLEALLHVKRDRPDAVILDLRMPRLGGIEALRRIREFDAGIDVVVMTGDVDEAMQREALALGARAVLTKPVPLGDLVATLRRDGDGDTAPAVVRDEPDPEDERLPAPRAASGIRVLVVDDDAGVRDMLAEYLAVQGYEVATEPDAASAIRALVDRAPDVVLLDINMPGLTGEAALPAIRAVAPRAAVIMVSATVDEDVARRTLAHGAFDYLVKPVDMAYLVRSIETAVTMGSLDA